MRPAVTLSAGDNPEVTFEEARQQIMTFGKPLLAVGDDLLAKVIDFDTYLTPMPGLARVDVRQTPTGPIVALCVAQEGASPDAVAGGLVDVWQQKLRYPYREAHQVRRSPGMVQLDFITQIDEGDSYVTGMIIVRWP